MELDPAIADEWRRKVGCGQRAAAVEQDGASYFGGSPAPFDAKLLRVEPDEPVGVLVEATWPQTDHSYRGAQAWRQLREATPERPPDRADGAVKLSHVAYVMRKAGALSDELSPAEVEYARREARTLESGGSA